MKRLMNVGWWLASVALVYLIPFNLACYCSQLHDFHEAAQWLKKAMAIDEKTVQKLAVDDPDLKPLWDSMGGTIWKRE